MQRIVFISLFTAIFSANLGMGIVAPLLPVYAQHFGATGLYIGLVFASFSITRTIFLPVVGNLSDKIGRKIFITSGLFLFSFASIGYIFASNITLLIFTRMLQGAAAAMVIPIALAYMGESSPKGKEGSYMGTFNLFFFGGLATGPILGGIVKDLAGIKFCFISMGAISFFGWLLAFIFLPEKKPPEKNKNYPAKGYLRFFQSRTLQGIFFYRLCFSTGIGVLWAFLPIFGDNILKLSSSQIGILISINIAVATILQTPFGMLADRTKKGWLVILGGCLAGISLIAISFSRNFLEIIFINFLLGISGGISMPALTALTVEEGKKMGDMGSMMSAFVLFHSIGMIVGPLFAGLSTQFINITVTFITGGVIGILGVIGFVLAQKYRLQIS